MSNDSQNRILATADSPSARTTLRIGLTGGIASGKTTIANLFADLGVDIVDTDIIARQVVEPGSDGLAEVVQSFGEEVLAADGSLDRRALRRIVFADDARRLELEAILHPRIREEAARQSGRSTSDGYHIVVVPLLTESPMKDDMDRVLVVDCSVETQLARLLSRDAETRQQAERILAAQASREERLSIADDVIVNDSDLDDARQQVLAVHERYLSLAGDRAKNRAKP